MNKYREFTTVILSWKGHFRKVYIHLQDALKLSFIYDQISGVLLEVFSTPRKESLMNCSTPS